MLDLMMPYREQLSAFSIVMIYISFDVKDAN